VEPVQVASVLRVRAAAKMVVEDRRNRSRKQARAILFMADSDGGRM
jgi:hypothetical protein